ncbi:MAG: hypothetical protein M3081_11745 [Gemmatimonadota bacterium]|nr:hypothetical protein [Gemmatimonadota bacterium]
MSIADELTQWLNHRFAKPGTRIEPHTALFADRLIDSIRILDLIAWTERALGRQIADVDIRMDNFASADRIAETFFAESGNARR